MGLRKLERLGITAVILSTEVNPVVSVRAQKLKVGCVHGLEDKGAALEALVEEMGLSWLQVAFVGNDINDLPCLERVGLPMVVGEAHPDVLGHAQYRTRRSGGKGAVREICDLFEQVLSGKE